MHFPQTRYTGRCSSYPVITAGWTSQVEAGVDGERAGIKGINTVKTNKYLPLNPPRSRYQILVYCHFPSRQPIQPIQPTMSISVTPEQLAVLRDTLLNTQGSTPLHERFRALFMLKAVGGDEVVQIISEGEVLHRTSVDRMRC
jgi:hypothetical protein